MQGTINKGDLALIIKFEKKNRPIFENGVFAINLDGRIVIRRLQFLQFSKRTLVHIVSDNKKYIDEQISLEELKIFGEVVWKSSNFQDIHFLKHEDDIPNLFSSEEDIEIPKFLETKKIKKEIA